MLDRCWMTLTQPNIAYVMSHGTQFSRWPIQTHWITMTQNLHYLRGTKDYGLMYNGMITNNDLKGFCDANFVGDQNDCKCCTCDTFSCLAMEP
jgi:hypothetical protein